MDRNIKINYIHNTIIKIYIKLIKVMLGLIVVAGTVTTVLNILFRSHLINKVIFAYVFLLVIIVIEYFFMIFVSKSNISSENKIFILATILVLMFCTTAVINFPMNHLMWAGLIIGIVVSIFVFNLYHMIVLQSLCYISLLIIMMSESFSTYILPQKITVFIILFVTSIISFMGKNVIRFLIENLIKEAELLKETNEKLEMRVAGRTLELEATTQELHATLEDLQSLQNRLLKTRSMDSFLSLVIGLSHQINTPLGASLTSISFIRNVVEKVKKSMEDDSLTRSMMVIEISKLQNAIDLVDDNINRSINVVSSLESFSLFEPVSEVRLVKSVSILKAELMLEEFYRYVDIEISINENIVLNIPDLTFRKIIRIIINNSVLHGQTKLPVIRIVATESGKNIKLEISDNGVGISNDIKDSIFEPFQSTSPHRLGMGLFIAESIVYHALNGKLYLDSDYTDGTKIVLIISKEIKMPDGK